MAFIKLVHVLVVSSWLFIGSSTALARELPVIPGQNLETRLMNANQGGNGDGDLVDCWNALLELKSCSNEIVLFFLNGETHLGPDCCGAISVITRNCWPAMLTSLGFTAEEGDVLRGYCAAKPVQPPAQSPVSQG